MWFNKFKIVSLTIGLLAGMCQQGMCQQPFQAVTSDESKFHLQLIDIFEFSYPLSIKQSSTGEWLTFIRQSADIMTDENDFSLWLIRTNGEDLQQIGDDDHFSGQVAWAPSGNKFAFLSNREGRPAIFIQDANTGAVERASDFIGGFPSELRWSPDESKIAFSMTHSLAPPLSIVIPDAPEGASWKADPRIFDDLDYLAADGSMISESVRQIHILNLEDGSVSQITQSNKSIGLTMDWMPNEDAIITEGYSTEDHNRYPFERDIFTVHIDNGEIHSLTNRDGYEGRAKASPSGDKIAFIAYDESYPGYPGYSFGMVFVMDNDGSNIVNLYESGHFDRSVYDFDWDPNEESLLIMYDDQGDTKLGRMALDGTVTKILDKLGAGALAYPQGFAFSVASNGNIIYSRKDEKSPGDIFIFEAKSQESRPVTNLNPFLENKKLGSVSHFDYQSSLDNTQLEGWYILPPDFDQTQSYPLLLEIHGGPYSNYGARFDLEKQIYASAGYIVAYVNPRGSTSHGKDFLATVFRKFPADDVQDLIDGVEFLQETLPIKRDQKFVVGGSAGGMLATAVIEETHQFSAAAILYPLADFASYVISSAPWVEVMQATFAEPPWRDPEPYFERSVLSHVEKIDTPALLMTGGKDHQSPVFQTESIYRALRWEGKDALLVIVPDETHGIRDHPSHYMTKLQTVITWFEKFRH